MAEFRSEFLNVVQARGFVHQCTDAAALDAALVEGKPASAYIGFDLTADSLHVGSLVQIMLLRWFQKCGHKPIVLLGGGTTKIGDPSGKDDSRQLLDEAEIARNKAGVRRVFERFLKFGDGQTDAVVIDNAEWLDALGYITFLREVGRHFSVNRMLGFESVKLRLEREQPLTFLEFNYMVLQAYDFVELARRRRCVLQMGGSDQWGNIVSGVELARRIDDRSLYGLTAPLITTSSGEKMGKTARGAVWLNADRLAPYDYWQFWRNTEDTDVVRFLKLFTELPDAEIARIARLQGEDINAAKIALANAGTALAHGPEAAAEAAETARRTFEEGGLGDALPKIAVPQSELAHGIAAFELFRRAGLAASGGEARRLVKGGGAKINDRPVASETQTVTLADVNQDGVIKLSAGRKRHAILHPIEDPSSRPEAASKRS
jgi:tyrosyl-tRNA synthetase